MYNEFTVTDLGLSLNGKMLMPGSKLLHKNEPHPSWKNCGHASGQVGEKKLVVASPAAASADPDIEAVRAKYEQVTGKKPHHKAKAETLLAEIAEQEKQ